MAAQFFRVSKKSKKCSIQEFKTDFIEAEEKKIRVDPVFVVQNIVTAHQTVLLPEALEFIESARNSKGMISELFAEAFLMS